MCRVKCHRARLAEGQRRCFIFFSMVFALFVAYCASGHSRETASERAQEFAVS